MAAESEAVLVSEQDRVASRRDYRTGALTVAVIALAVLLGWMVGRVGWSMAVSRVQPQLPLTSEPAQPAAQANPELRRPCLAGRNQPDPPNRLGRRLFQPRLKPRETKNRTRPASRWPGNL